jgi:carboxypeptidase family protein
MKARRPAFRAAALALALAAGGCASSSRALTGSARSAALLCRGRVSVRVPGTSVRSVAGRTVDPSGKALPGVAVVLVAQDAATSVYQATSDGAGRFVVGGVPDGRYLLKTCRTGFETVEMDLEVSGDGQAAPLVLEMAPGT